MGSGSASAQPAGASRAAAILKSLLWLPSFYYLGTLVWVISQRLTFPYEMEWLEGGTVDTIVRVLHGQAIYVKPSVDFISYLYTPLYYWVCALAMKVVGIGWFAPRLVSVLATAGTLAVIFAIVYRRTRDLTWALVGAALYAASYHHCGAWFDLARVDPLCVFWVVAAVLAVEVFPNTRGEIAAALLFFAGFASKQQVAVYAAFFALYLLFGWGWRRASVFALAFGIPTAALVLFQTWNTQGWFYYYCFIAPRRHVAEKGATQWFFDRDLRVYLVGLFLVALAGRLARRRGENFLSAREPLYWMFWAGIVATYLSRRHSGGWDNVVMFMVVFFAVLFPLAFAVLEKEIQGEPIARKRLAASSVLTLAAVVQFGTLYYSPRDQIPSARTVARGRGLLQKISRYQSRGPVIVISHGYYVPSLGGPMSMNLAAFGDLWRFVTPDRYSWEAYWQFQQRLEQGYYAAVFMDELRGEALNFPIRKYYRLEEEIYEPLCSVTGLIHCPRYIFVPRSGPDAEPPR